MRSGTLVQLLNTLTLCCVFFGMGLTKSLIESPVKSVGPIEPTQKEMATSTGYVVGFLIGGMLLAKFSRNFIMLLTMNMLGSMLLVVPWISSMWATYTVYSLIGISVAILMIGGNVICLDFWGKRSGPYIQALHFCLSLGLLTGPLLVDPLSQTKVPVIVQNALPLPKPANNNISNSLAAMGHASAMHIIVKRDATINHQPTLDPFLANLFASRNSEDLTNSTTTTITSTIKTPKPKPAFNDGQKLDNSRDWEKVKVAQPPAEEVAAPSTTTSTTKSTTSLLLGPSIEEIFGDASSTTTERNVVKEEMAELDKDIQENDQLLDWLNDDNDLEETKTRFKRDLGVKGGQGFGDIGPPLYNRPHLSHPRPHHGSRPQWPRVKAGMADWQPPYASYDIPSMYDTNDYDIAYGQQQQQQEASLTIAPPPKNVEKAFETIQNYLDHPEGSEQSSPAEQKTTTTKRTTTTTKKTTTTTIRTTTEEEPPTTMTTSFVTFPSLANKTRRKKPKSSFDNDTENDVTLRAILGNYGVSQSNVGFILDATYTWLVSIVLVVCMCYRPRSGEPRSREEAEAMFGCSQRRSEENRIFKATVTVLLFFFNLLHWGMFVSFGQTLPRFHIMASTAPYLQRVFVGVFTATRFLAILTAGILNPALAIFASLFITFVGSLVLVFTQQISATAVWAGVILQAVGLSTLLPTSLVWGEAYVLMSSQAVAIVCWGLALGELMVPHIMTLLTIEAQTWLGLAMLGATTLCAGLFTCVFLMARRHGSRFSRPQSSGYELASQDELNQELLDDDEDFEVSEPTLQLTGGHETQA